MLTGFETPDIDSLIGVYGSYEEANFIRSKVRFPNQAIISTTELPVTTTKVADFLHKRKIFWNYSKN